MLKQIFSEEAASKISNSKILLVGCGGIGCELVKNIIKLGFKHLVLVDNDYVELSNLNRQFYFSRDTINKSKSKSIEQMLINDYPDIKVKAYYCDIQERFFFSNFYNHFSLVLSALDNKEAKEHLCLMCIKYDLPLIIVGAEGYKGQIKTIIRGKYECLFCDQKSENEHNQFNEIPVCQVRGVPELSHHCVIWAQYFLDSLLFNENKKFLLKREILVNKKDIEIFWMDVFDEIFKIENNILISDITKINKLEYHDAIDNKSTLLNDGTNNQNQDEEKYHNLSDYVKEFMYGLEFLYQLSKQNQKMQWATTEYKKISLYTGEEHIINFLTAATNLRIFIFKKIKQKLRYLNKYEVKTIVGNIVPSIASTNSIVGSIQIMEAMKLILSSDKKIFNSKTKWVGDHQIDKITLSNPISCKPSCKVCSLNILYLRFKVDFNKVCLEQIIMILKTYKEFEIGRILYEGSFIMYDWEDIKLTRIYKENLKKTIKNLINEQQEKHVQIRITNANKKMNFEWDLTLQDEVNDEFDIINDDPKCKENITYQLHRYFEKKDQKKTLEARKFFKKNIL